MLLDLREDGVLGDGPSKHEAADEQTNDEQYEDERPGGRALLHWPRRAQSHQRARCARKSSSRIVAAPASMSRAPRISASLEVCRSS